MAFDLALNDWSLYCTLCTCPLNFPRNNTIDEEPWTFIGNKYIQQNNHLFPQEYSWLQSLFEVVSDYLYKPSFFNVECEDLCLDILDIILARNENKLPIDHTVLSPSSLKPFQGGNYFTGQFGQTSKSANHSGWFKKTGKRIEIIPVENRECQCNHLLSFLTGKTSKI